MLIVAFVSAGTAAIGIPARSTYGAQVSVDEPQYLMTALSLGKDFNLDISDEIENGEYLPFHEVPLNTQTFDLDTAGQRLSPHDPLLPLLLAGPMHLGGWPAARATLALMTGLLAASTLWLAVRRFGVSVNTAAWVIGSLSASPPIVSYGSQIYPEVPAALAIVLAVSLASGNASKRSLCLFIPLIAALPWLSVKYLPAVASLTILFLIRLCRSAKQTAAILVTTFLIGFGVIYLIAHQKIYGGWTVYAAGDHFVESEFHVLGINPDYWGRTRRIVGLLIDRGFGLIPWTPAFLTLPAFLGSFARQRPRGWELILIPLAVGWASATWMAFTMHGWWWPGRQLVFVLPLALVVIAHGIDRAQKILVPLVASALIGTGAWIWLAVEASTGHRTIVVDFQETLWPGYRLLRWLFPDASSSIGSLIWTGLWAAGLAALVLYGYRSLGRNKNSGGSESTNTHIAAIHLDGSSTIG